MAQISVVASVQTLAPCGSDAQRPNHVAENHASLNGGAGQQLRQFFDIRLSASSVLAWVASRFALDGQPVLLISGKDSVG